LSNILSSAIAKCFYVMRYALNAYRTFKDRTYCCDSGLYICWVRRSIAYRAAQ